MTELTPTETTNLDRYDNAPLEWTRAEQALSAEYSGPGPTYFLGTARPDGTTHSAGVGALWRQGFLYFTSSPGARKARDLEANPHGTISVALPGIDLVFTGKAARVTDAETLEELAAGYRAGGWPATVDGDAFTAPFSAPSAGPPPWYLYRFTFDTVVGVATADPHGATRWRFQR